MTNQTELPGLTVRSASVAIGLRREQGAIRITGDVRPAARLRSHLGGCCPEVGIVDRVGP